jgi:hypothetical protein
MSLSISNSKNQGCEHNLSREKHMEGSPCSANIDSVDIIHVENGALASAHFVIQEQGGLKTAASDIKIDRIHDARKKTRSWNWESGTIHQFLQTTSSD